MREILFDLTEDLCFPKIAFGGFEGEHNATRLTLRLPERLIAEGAKYYMVFETSGEEMIFSAPLLLEEGAISALLPRQVMTSPDVTVHAAAYRTEGEELIEIAKSPRVLLEIKCPEAEGQKELSCDGGEIPGLVIESALLPESENPVSSRALCGKFSDLDGETVESAYVDERGELVLKKKNRTLFTAGSVVGPRGEKGDQGERGDKGEQGEKGDVGAPDYSLVANALKGKVSGTAVSITDVSPLEHGIKIRLGRYDATSPYYKYDFNGDGKVDEEDAAHLLYHENFPDVEEYDCAWWTDQNISRDAFSKLLESGDESAFEKANPFEGVTLTKCGKNLLSYPYERSSITVAGITYTDNGDGTLTATGTPTYQFGATFMLTKVCPFKSGVTYTFSEAALRAQGFRFSLCYFDKEQNKEMYPDKLYRITWDDSKYQFKHLAIDNGSSLAPVDSVVLCPQIEIGTVETEYEPYKGIEIVPVNADGTAKIYGNGESITLFTDEEGVTVEAEYNRDLAKAIDRLEKALKGGN